MTVAAEKDAFVMGLSVETQPGFFLKENLFKGIILKKKRDRENIS